MRFSIFPSAAAVVSALFISAGMATPISNPSTAMSKRGDIDIQPGTFSQSAGTDLTLCYEAGFRQCTPKMNIKMNTCLSYNRNDLPDHDPDKWRGFTNDAISSFAITGHTPAQCTLFTGINCRTALIVANSINGPLYEPNIVENYGGQANDAVSSVMCITMAI